MSATQEINRIVNDETQDEEILAYRKYAVLLKELRIKEIEEQEQAETEESRKKISNFFHLHDIEPEGIQIREACCDDSGDDNDYFFVFSYGGPDKVSVHITNGRVTELKVGRTDNFLRSDLPLKHKKIVDLLEKESEAAYEAFANLPEQSID